jgi:iron(III) transport system substrate-binding protein
VPFAPEDHHAGRFDNPAWRGKSCGNTAGKEAGMSVTRRTALLGLAGTAFASGGHAAPPGEPVTDQLVAAAKKEGVVVFHSSIELSVCQAMIDGFNKHYPDVKVQLERSGAERILQRITQEYASNIHAADFVESSDMGTFVDWKKKGWLAAYVPTDVAQSWPGEERDPDGRFASIRASLSVLAYNTRQVKAEDAPKSFADLLNPRWRMRLVKAHPSYSGSILTSTYATAKALGWEYFEKLAKQRVMQVQSAVDPGKKVAQGERSVAADGSEYVVLNLQDAGEPILPIYATEGSPIFSGQAAVMEAAPHPNAARLFSSYVFSTEGQQLMADVGNLRSYNPKVRPKPGHVDLKDVKLLRTDPNELAAAAEEVKRRYGEIFGV